LIHGPVGYFQRHDATSMGWIEGPRGGEEHGDCGAALAQRTGKGTEMALLRSRAGGGTAMEALLKLEGRGGEEHGDSGAASAREERPLMVKNWGSKYPGFPTDRGAPARGPLMWRFFVRLSRFYSAFDWAIIEEGRNSSPSRTLCNFAAEQQRGRLRPP